MQNEVVHTGYKYKTKGTLCVLDDNVYQILKKRRQILHDTQIIYQQTTVPDKRLSFATIFENNERGRLTSLSRSWTGHRKMKISRISVELLELRLERYSMDRHGKVKKDETKSNPSQGLL